MLNAALSGAAACVHVFPAVFALAKNPGMQGVVAFARLVGDASGEASALMRSLRVEQARPLLFLPHKAARRPPPQRAVPVLTGAAATEQVPTFIFFRRGEEVRRFVGSSRGDLIGQILEEQARAMSRSMLAALP